MRTCTASGVENVLPSSSSPCSRTHSLDRLRSGRRPPGDGHPRVSRSLSFRRRFSILGGHCQINGRRSPTGPARRSRSVTEFTARLTCLCAISLTEMWLRRDRFIPRWNHEQRRVGFSGESVDFFTVATQMLLDRARGTVPDHEPDDLRRCTVQEGTATEVAILRHDDKAVLLRVSPDDRVVRGRQTDRSNMNDIGPDVAKAVTEPR